jgi:hypothetical protein
MAEQQQVTAAQRRPTAEVPLRTMLAEPKVAVPPRTTLAEPKAEALLRLITLVERRVEVPQLTTRAAEPTRAAATQELLTVRPAAPKVAARQVVRRVDLPPAAAKPVEPRRRIAALLPVAAPLRADLPPLVVPRRAEPQRTLRQPEPLERAVLAEPQVEQPEQAEPVEPQVEQVELAEQPVAQAEQAEPLVEQVEPAEQPVAQAEPVEPQVAAQPIRPVAVDAPAVVEQPVEEPSTSLPLSTQRLPNTQRLPHLTKSSSA